MHASRAHTPVPRFTHFHTARTGTEFLLRVCYLEVHNEEINDLLAPAVGEGRNLKVGTGTPQLSLPRFPCGARPCRTVGDSCTPARLRRRSCVTTRCAEP